MNKVFLGLGSNLGDRQCRLNVAIEGIHERIGRIISRSSFYDTSPWGFHSDHRFLNAVVEVETPLSPGELLPVTQQLEKEAGRIQKTAADGYSDRPIDIDILFFNDLIIQDEQLQIPHPYIAKRDFVLLPLVEIAPDLQHPLLKKSMRELLQELLTSQ